MEKRKLKKEYKEYVFIKDELEECLGFALEQESNSLPDYLIPYKARVGIQLTEAANILAGVRPQAIINQHAERDIVFGYKDLLWDAVDNGILSGTNELTDYNFNQEYRVDITLVKNEVTNWAQKHKLNWPFEIEKDGKILNNKENPEDIIKQLTAENESLRKELFDTKNKIPSLLRKYRDDDPLFIAINLRNDEWRNYQEDERLTVPTVDYLVAKLMAQYADHGMSNILAKSIEKIACPIKRK